MSSVDDFLKVFDSVLSGNLNLILFLRTGFRVTIIYSE